MEAKNRLGDLTLDYAQSDESFAYLRDGVDEAWARANISASSHNIYVIEHVYVFDREDRLVFASHSAPSPADEASPDVGTHEELGRLLLAARTAGAKDPTRGLEVRPVRCMARCTWPAPR